VAVTCTAGQRRGTEVFGTHTLSGDLSLRGDTVQLRLDPASAPRRSRALAALCTELTATETTYPGTALKIAYSVKGQLDDLHPYIDQRPSG